MIKTLLIIIIFVLPFIVFAQCLELKNYIHTSNAAISGHNKRHLKNVTPCDCANACNKEINFDCKSFDYYKKERKCDLSDKSAKDVGGLKTDYSGNPYDHYSKIIETKSYIRTPNAAISGHNKKQLANVTPEDCAQACDEETTFNCKSFDYYKKERKCDLSDKDAKDVGGLKTNYSGNPYDHYLKKIRLIKTINSYTKISNAAISGHNKKQLTNVTPEDCARACDEETTFNCKSFDYYKKEQKCDLSDKNAQDVGGLKTNYSGNPYDHYSK